MHVLDYEITSDLHWENLQMYRVWCTLVPDFRWLSYEFGLKVQKDENEGTNNRRETRKETGRKGRNLERMDENEQRT